MKDPIRFYFDFISPYGYLCAQVIDDIAQKHGREVDWCPLLLGVTVLKVMGLKPVSETPLKNKYVLHDVPRLAKYLGVPFNRPKGELKPLPPLRAFVWLNKENPTLAKTFAKAFFKAQWAHARNLSEPNDVAEFAAGLGFDKTLIREAIRDPEVKQLLVDHVDDAIQKGVFGVPSLLIDGELFWGVEQLPMIDQWLKKGGW